MKAPEAIRALQSITGQLEHIEKASRKAPATERGHIGLGAIGRALNAIDSAIEDYKRYLDPKGENGC